MTWGEAEEVAGLVDGVEGLVAAHLPAHLHPVVEAVPDLLRRRSHGHVGVGDVEDLVAQPVGLEAALHHLAQVAGVDVGEQVAAPQRRVGEEGGNISAYSCGSMTLLIRRPYTSAPVRAWKERAVTSPATFDIA